MVGFTSTYLSTPHTTTSCAHNHDFFCDTDVTLSSRSLSKANSSLQMVILKTTRIKVLWNTITIGQKCSTDLSIAISSIPLVSFYLHRIQKRSWIYSCDQKRIHKMLMGKGAFHSLFHFNSVIDTNSFISLFLHPEMKPQKVYLLYVLYLI